MDWFKSTPTTEEKPAESTSVFGSLFSSSPAPAAPTATEPQESVGTSIGNFFSGIGASIQTKIDEAAAERAKAAEEERIRLASQPPQPTAGEQISGFFAGLGDSIASVGKSVCSFNFILFFF